MSPPPSRLRDRLSALVQTVAAAAMLLWPLAFAGRPLVFGDDSGYWRLGRLFVVQGLGLDRRAPDPADLITGAQVVARHVLADPRLFSTLAGARSGAYALFLFATQQAGGLWLTVAVQALVAAMVLRVAWRAVAPGAAGWTWLAAVAALAAGSSLAFFASFAMPDLFAGLGLLCVALLAFWPDRLDRARRIFLWGVLAASLAVHAAHLLLALAVVPAALAILWRLGTPRRAILVRGGVLAAAVAAAGLSGVTSDAAFRAVTGLSPHRPPFLAARLLADGPGRVRLRRACAHGAPYRLCAFAGEPLDNSDDILWHDDPRTGVFMVSDFAGRLALEREEPRFVRDVALADPLGVALAVARDAGRQIGRFYVDDPLHDPCQERSLWFWRQSAIMAILPDAAACRPGAGLYLPPLPFYALDAAVLLAAMLALVRLAREEAARPSDDGRRLLAAAGLVGAGLLFNATLCGAVSGPFARYEARLAWLVPMLGLAAAHAAWKRRRPAHQRGVTSGLMVRPATSMRAE